MLIKEELLNPIGIGQRIKDIRSGFNCTMEQFGQFVGVTSKSAVYNWEHGKRLPSEEKLELIAILGKTTVSQLLYGELDVFIDSLFEIDSKAYRHIKAFYVDRGYNELFESYELASPEIRQSIIEMLVKKSSKRNWSYTDAPHIADTFISVANSTLEINRYTESLSAEIKDLLRVIKEKNLTESQLTSLLAMISSYLRD